MVQPSEYFTKCIDYLHRKRKKAAAQADKGIFQTVGGAGKLAIQYCGVGTNTIQMQPIDSSLTGGGDWNSIEPVEWKLGWKWKDEMAGVNSLAVVVNSRVEQQEIFNLYLFIIIIIRGKLRAVAVGLGEGRLCGE